jgi:photosystem II stability/assembly factor-like uncharacterized protein
MKKFSTILIALLLLGFITKAQEYLSVSRTDLQFSRQLSSDTITVFSNTNWTCGFDQNWLSVSCAGGTGDSIISITAYANPLTTARTAHLIVSGTGVAAQTVTITQAASPLLSVSADSLVIGALANSTCSLKIASLPDWSAASDQPWLTLQPSSFVNPVTYAGTYSASGVRVHPTSGNIFFNDQLEVLTMVDSVTITKLYAGDYPAYTVQLTITNSTIIVGGKTMQVVNVTVIGAPGSGTLATDQSGNPTNYFDPSTRTFNLSYFYNTAAPRKIYEVLVGTLTTSTVTMTATASANPTSAIRQAAITITANGVPDKIVKVTQEASPIFAVSTKTLYLPAAANSSAAFNINSLTNWTVESNQNWLTLSKTSGSNKDTITVTASENASGKSRNAILTITGTGDITKTIDVIQYSKVPATGKWNQYYSGNNNTELSIVNDSVFWFCRSSNNTISYTLDGGRTWNVKNLPSNISGNTGFCAVSATTAYIACGSGTEIGLYKTTDGADSWTLEPTGYSKNKPTSFYGYSFPDFVYFWDTNNGLVYGDDNEIYITTNSGAQWNRVLSTTLQSGIGEWSFGTQEIYKITGNTIYILVNNQSYHTRILKSNDRGLTWSWVNTPTNTMNASFDFKDDNNGLYVDYNTKPSKLFSTTDGGQKWILINSTDNLHTLKYIPNQNLYISTYTVNGLQYTADNGQTWEANPSFNFNSAATYNAVISPDGLTTYVTGNGYIYSSQNAKGVNISFDHVTLTSPTTLDLSFSNNVDLASSQDTANYVLIYNSGNLLKSTAGSVNRIKTISVVRDNSDFALVHLTTENALPVDTITVNVNNVFDIEGFPTINGSTASTQAFALNFDLSATTMDIGAAENSSNTFSITSNLPWEITSDQSWLGANITSGSGNSIITLTAAANATSDTRVATVTITVPGFTSQTITVNQAIDITGIDKFENSGISIFPIPAKSILFVKGISQNATVSICDLTGQIIMSDIIPVNQIDINHLTNGIYILKIIDNNRVYTKRFVKQ